MEKITNVAEFRNFLKGKPVDTKVAAVHNRKLVGFHTGKWDGFHIYVGIGYDEEFGKALIRDVNYLNKVLKGMRGKSDVLFWTDDVSVDDLIDSNENLEIFKASLESDGCFDLMVEQDEQGILLYPLFDIKVQLIKALQNK